MNWYVYCANNPVTWIDPDGLNTIEDYYYQKGERKSQATIDSLQIEYYSRLVGNRQVEKFTDVNQTLIENQDFRYQVLADYANNLNENEVSIFDLMKNDPAIYSALQITAVGTAGNIQDLANVIENLRTTFGYGSGTFARITGVDFATAIIQDITRPSTQEQALLGMAIASVFIMPMLFEAAPVLTAKLSEISFNAQLKLAQLLGVGGFSSSLSRGFNKVSSRIGNWLGNKLGGNVTEFANNAFNVAKNQYPKQFQQYSKLNQNQLQKAINSHVNQILKHQGFLQNPSSHVPNWSSLTSQHQANLIHHWTQDISRHQSYLEIAKGLLSGGS